MANSAPRATRSAHGHPLPNWGISLRYDTQQDLLILSWHRSDLLNNRGRKDEASFAPEDLEDALARIQVLGRTYVARSLF